jgi:hypothetical protein
MKTFSYEQTPSPFVPMPAFDVPKWVIGSGESDLAQPLLEEFKFPDKIVLVGTLRPIWVDAAVKGCYSDDGGSQFVPISLYRECSALARIEWVADWQEGLDGGTESLTKPFVFSMDFIFQQNDVLAQYRLPSYEHPGFWALTGKSLEPVWSWGGAYRPGCALVDIRQRYFSLTPDGAQRGQPVGHQDSHQDSRHAGATQIATQVGTKIATKIAWVSSLNPHYQKLCDATATDKTSASAIFQPMSLLNHIQFGSIRYFLPHVNDSVGYQSADVVDYDPQNGRVKLLFLRRNHGNTAKKS